MISQPVTETSILKVSKDTAAIARDVLAIEEPLEIGLAFKDAPGNSVQKSLSVTMRTPGNDRELAAGFLFTEGIIRDKTDIAAIQLPVENKVIVTLSDEVQPVLRNTERNFYTTSSCGVCGKASIEAIHTVSCFESNTDTVKLRPEMLYALPGVLSRQQKIFESTGGLHAAALFAINGDLIMLSEDVGRHNALDKLIGTAFLEGRLPLDEVILLLSGRASFELVQKATMAGISIIAAVGAPSSLAVSLAAERGITLVGFLRGERFNVYSGKERMIV